MLGIALISVRLKLAGSNELSGEGPISLAGLASYFRSSLVRTVFGRGYSVQIIATTIWWIMGYSRCFS